MIRTFVRQAPLDTLLAVEHLFACPHRYQIVTKRYYARPLFLPYFIRRATARIERRENMSREDRRELTLSALAFIALATYLINPQFVAGLVWDFFTGLFIFLGWR